MTPIRKILFFVGCIGLALILHFFPYQESRVVRLSLERQWNAEQAVRSKIQDNCDVIENKKDTVFGKAFVGWLKMSGAPAEKARTCYLFTNSARNRIFLFKSLWLVKVKVVSDNLASIVEKTYQVESPKPLCYLPLLIFALGIILDIRVWGLGFLIPSYLFVLSGGNVTRVIELSYQYTVQAVYSEQTFLGIALIVLWLAFLHARVRTMEGGLPVESTPSNRLGNRALISVIGLLNPILYSWLGRFLLGGKRRRWLYTFLDNQVLLTALGLYLLTIGIGPLSTNLHENFLLPRYFTFAAIAFVLVNFWLKPQGKYQLIARLPNLGRALGFVVAFELTRYFYFPQLEINWATRIGIPLALSELLWPFKVSIMNVSKTFAVWGGVLFLSYFIAIITHESGLVDLSAVMINPRIHPRFILFYTFIAGVLIGFVCGNFTMGFLSLFVFLKSPQLPLLRAAILDGIIAGSLLSPFSLFNLIPAAQFRLPLKQLVAYRFRQLGPALLVGTLIYIIAALNSVAILRPATFVFCCLVAIAYQLRRIAWDLRRSRRLLISDGNAS